jgi:hypothetical protein
LEHWVREQWNKPSRSDNYVMQLTADVRSIMSNRQWYPKDCKMSWNFTYQTDALPSNEEEAARLNRLAEERTMAALGVNWLE